MDDLFNFVMEKLVGRVVKSKHLSKTWTTVIVFLILNLPTAALVAFGCMDLFTTKVGFYVFSFVLAAIWLAITVFAVFCGHKKNWNI